MRAVAQLIACGVNFPQKSPKISRSFAKNDLQLQTSYGSLPPCILLCVLLKVQHDIYASYCRANCMRSVISLSNLESQSIIYFSTSLFQVQHDIYASYCRANCIWSVISRISVGANWDLVWVFGTSLLSTANTRLTNASSCTLRCVQFVCCVQFVSFYVVGCIYCSVWYFVLVLLCCVFHTPT